MVGPALATAGSVILPQVGQALANMGGQFLQNKFGANQGQTNVGGAQKVVDFIKSNNLQIDPEHVAALQEAAARDNQQFTQGMTRSDNLFGASLSNQVANLNNERSAAMNAQTQAANLAGQQMQNAANRASANANAVQGAISAGLGLAR